MIFVSYCESLAKIIMQISLNNERNFAYFYMNIYYAGSHLELIGQCYRLILSVLHQN